jgi:multiple sugar transport system substrate-binding protein
MLAGFLCAVVGVSLLLLALFAAWGRATSRPAASGAARLLFTGWGGIIERQVFSDLVAEFARRNPGIAVDYRPIPRDYATKLKLMFAGGTPPDVFYLPDGDFPSFAVAGRVLDLQPLVDRSSIIREQEIWESGLRRYRYDGRVFGRGRLYALPKDIGPTAMFVNLDLLRAAGVPVPPAETPMTWPEALQLWKRLARDTNGDGRTDQWGTHGMTLEAAVWSHGGEFLSADGRRFVMPDDARAMEAAEWLAGLQAVHRVAPMQRQQQSIPVDVLFLTGRLATFMGGRWMVPQFRNARFQWDVVPVPVSPRTRKQAGWSGSVGLAISPSTRHREAAWRLVEFLSGPEGQTAQAKTGFQIPNQKSLSRTQVFLQPGRPPAHAAVFVEAAGYQQAGPQTRTPDDEWWKRVHEALAPAYRGEVPAADAIKRARKEIQEALDRSWRAR